MSIAHLLAGTRTPRTEAPNIQLAEQIVATQNTAAITELATLADTGRKKQRHDSLKVLYEIGLRTPALVLPQLETLLDQLEDNDNRVLWSTIYCLLTITPLAPAEIHSALPQILEASSRSTIIAEDKTLRILAHLCSLKPYHKQTVAPLLAHIAAAATNQFPTYIAIAEPHLQGPERTRLAKLIRTRKDLDKYPAKRKNADKILKKLEA